MAILGLNPLSTRLISVLAGTFAVLGIYLLTNELFKKNKYKLPFKLTIGHITAFLLTINPWHFFISRPALEANLSLTLIIFGAYYLIKGKKSWILSSILLGLSLHTYNTARVFSPLLLVGYLFLYKPKISLKKDYLPIVIFLLSFSIFVYQIFTGTGIARYDKLAILNTDSVYQIELSRQQSTLSPLITKLVNNRPVFFVKQFTHNYLSYFSLPFLYQSQGSQKQFAIPIKNLFTLMVTILALSSIILHLVPLKNKKLSSFIKNPQTFVIFWLLISPIAAATTNSPPQALRPNPMIPSVVILAAYSVIALYNYVGMNLKKPKLATVLSVYILLITVFSFYKYWNAYHTEYKKTYSQAWQYGYKEAFEYIKENKDKYDKIFMSKALAEPHIFYAFYNQLNPKILQPGGDSLRFEQSDWFWTDRVKNIYFVNDWEIPGFEDAPTLTLESGETIDTKNSLILTSSLHTPSNTKIIKFIEYLDGSISFVVAEFK